MNAALIIFFAITGKKLADFEYDETGNLTAISIGGGQPYRLTYDDGHLLTITGSSGIPINFTTVDGVVTGNHSPAGTFVYRYADDGRLIGIGRA